MFGGWLFLASSVAYLAVAMVLPLTDAKEFSIWSIHLLAFVLPLILATVITLRYAKSL